MNNFLRQTFVVVTVFVVAYIPSLIYSFIQPSDDLKFRYIPNAIVHTPPEYIQILKTSQEVSHVKNAPIRNAHLASLGSAVSLGKLGLSLISVSEIKYFHHRVQKIGSQKRKIISVGDFRFSPNALLVNEPREVQILHTSTEVEIAKHMESLLNKDLLEVGAAITCFKNLCTTIAKKILQEDGSELEFLGEYESSI